MNKKAILELLCWCAVGWFLPQILPLPLVLALMAATTIFICGAALRNIWVFNTRMRWVLDQSRVRTIDYHSMMWRWWCWSKKPEDWVK